MCSVFKRKSSGKLLLLILASITPFRAEQTLFSTDRDQTLQPRLLTVRENAPSNPKGSHEAVAPLSSTMHCEVLGDVWASFAQAQANKP